MEISEETIEAAARHYAVFAFDEGTPADIRAAKDRFNELLNESYVALIRTAVMSGFHRPTAGEFRNEFITQCRGYLRRKGLP